MKVNFRIWLSKIYIDKWIERKGDGEWESEKEGVWERQRERERKR